MKLIFNKATELSRISVLVYLPCVFFSISTQSPLVIVETMPGVHEKQRLRQSAETLHSILWAGFLPQLDSIKIKAEMSSCIILDSAPEDRLLVSAGEHMNLSCRAWLRQWTPHWEKTDLQEEGINKSSVSPFYEFQKCPFGRRWWDYCIKKLLLRTEVNSMVFIL